MKPSRHRKLIQNRLTAVLLIFTLWFGNLSGEDLRGRLDAADSNDSAELADSPPLDSTLPSNPPATQTEDRTNQKQPDRESIWIPSIASLGNGEFIAATATSLLLNDASVATLNTSQPTQLAKHYKHSSSVWCVAAAADGSLAASVDYQGNLAVFDRSADQLRIFNHAAARWSRAMKFKDDCMDIVIGNEAGDLLTWSVKDSSIVSKIHLVDQPILAIERLTLGEQTGWLLCDRGGVVGCYDDQWNLRGQTMIGQTTAGRPKATSSYAALSIAIYGDDLWVGGSDRKVHRFKLQLTDRPTTTLDKSIPKTAGDFIATFSEASVACTMSDWVAALCVVGPDIYVGDMQGKISILRPDRIDEVQMASGVWTLAADGNRVFAGTRRHGVVEVIVQ